MRAKQKLLHEFVFLVSHDIRHSISSITRILKKRVHKSIPAETRKLAEHINKANHRGGSKKYVKRAGESGGNNLIEENRRSLPTLTPACRLSFAEEFFSLSLSLS